MIFTTKYNCTYYMYTCTCVYYYLILFPFFLHVSLPLLRASPLSQTFLGSRTLKTSHPWTWSRCAASVFSSSLLCLTTTTFPFDQGDQHGQRAIQVCRHLFMCIHCTCTHRMLITLLSCLLTRQWIVVCLLEYMYMLLLLSAS